VGVERYIYVAALFVVYCAPQIDEHRAVALTKWMLEVSGDDKGTIGPVPWEFLLDSGGAGLTYDGYANLSTPFTIDRSFLATEPLFFYTDCLDDAGELYLNGTLTGKAGAFPRSFPENMQGYQSNVWRAVLIPLHPELLREGTNELRLRVFDYAGLGGFCFAQVPVIAPYSAVAARHAFRPYFNDLIKTSFVVVFLMLLVWFLRRSKMEGPFAPLKILQEIRRLLALPAYSLLRNGRSSIAGPEMQARLLLGAMLSFATATYMVSEINLFRDWLPYELFWIKFGPIVFFIGVFAMLALLQKEAMDLFRPEKRISQLLLQWTAVLTHSLLALVFCLYLCLVPFQQTWGEFTVTGLIYWLCIATVLFLTSAIGLLRYAFVGRDASLHPQALKEGALRLFCLAGLITANYLWHSRSPYIQFSFLLVSVFLMLLAATMLRFQTKYRLRLPLLDGPLSLNALIQEKFSLTEREAQIVLFFHQGQSRKDAPAALGISPGTLKNHMKSIYAKTIERDLLESSTERDKLARLMVLLGRIENPGQ